MEKYEDIKEIEGYPKIPLGRCNDLRGQKKERLTILYRTKAPQTITTKKKPVYWLCKCDCGNYTVVKASHLQDGTTKSCGCYNKEQTSKRSLIDLTGENFGFLTVISRDPNEYIRPNGDKYIKWICKCECGTIKSIDGHELRQGETLSCGCYGRKRSSETHLIDLTGQKFGNIVVLKRAEKNYHSLSGKSFAVQWECKCKCGNTFIARGVDLKSGSIQSCGCQRGSSGEQAIMSLLEKFNIPFEKEKSFLTCQFKDTNHLARFDFYISNNNYLIEFDGEQHFKLKKGWQTEVEFIKTQEHDIYKNQWCKENNIPLIRIPYTHLKDLCIEDLLLETTEYRVV